MREKINVALDKLFEKAYIGILVAIVLFWCVMHFVAKIPASSSNMTNIILISASLIFSLFFMWFRGDHMYSCGIKKYKLKAFIPMLIIVVIVAVVVTTKFVSAKTISFPIICGAGLIALRAGILEELMVRAIPLGNTLFRKNDFKSMFILAVFSSAIFGLWHAGNIVETGDVVASVAQVVASFCAGIFFAALYLRTGSIIPGMAAHALWDFMTILDFSTVGEVKAYTNIADQVAEVAATSSISESAARAIIDMSHIGSSIAISVFWLILTAIILRKSKRDEVVENFKKY